VQHREFCNIPNTRNFFGIPGREKSGNLWQTKVELTKHRESSPLKNKGTSISMFYANHSIVKQRNHCTFPLSNYKPFHVCTGEIQVLLDGPMGNPKNVSCAWSLEHKESSMIPSRRVLWTNVRGESWYFFSGWKAPIGANEFSLRHWF
jgi:hypothetical protein